MRAVRKLHLAHRVYGPAVVENSHNSSGVLETCTDDYNGRWEQEYLLSAWVFWVVLSVPQAVLQVLLLLLAVVAVVQCCGGGSGGADGKPTSMARLSAWLRSCCCTCSIQKRWQRWQCPCAHFRSHMTNHVAMSEMDGYESQRPVCLAILEPGQNH